MINSVGPSFTGRMSVKATKTTSNVVRKVCQTAEKSENIKPKESFCKRFLDDMLYGLEMLAETFQIKL